MLYDVETDWDCQLDQTERLEQLRRKLNYHMLTCSQITWHSMALEQKPTRSERTKLVRLSRGKPSNRLKPCAYIDLSSKPKGWYDPTLHGLQEVQGSCSTLLVYHDKDGRVHKLERPLDSLISIGCQHKLLERKDCQ